MIDKWHFLKKETMRMHVNLPDDDLDAGLARNLTELNSMLERSRMVAIPLRVFKRKLTDGAVQEGQEAAEHGNDLRHGGKDEH